MTTSLALEGIKAKQQKTWESGDYGAVAALIHPISEALVQAADLSAGSRVLDVATGTGNAAIAAARCLCEVVAVDYVPDLMDRGRARADAEHLRIKFREADAEKLPCDDGEYDAVLSVVGVMFAPNQEDAAAEMIRVVRPGGTIALANWTPGGFIGRMFVVMGRHLPPPAGVAPPPRWGLPEHLELLFGAGAARISTTPRDFMLRYRSAAHFVDVFRTWYGPVHKAFAALSAEGQARLDADLHQLIAEFNEGGDGTMVVPAEYLEVIITRQ